MEKIKFRVLGNQIEVVERPAVITSGTVGLEAEFTFDSRWDSLSKTLVFKAGEKIIATALAGDTHSVPWEVLETPHQWLCVGVYGANRDGTVVIPTLWVKVAVIHTGTEPEGDPATDPTMPIWQEAVYLAERGTAAVEKVVAYWAPELCPGLDKPELVDIVNELVVCDRHVDYTLNEHLHDQENPHNITCQQLGALTMEHLMDVNALIQSVSEKAHNNAVEMAIHTNTDERPNPHEITCEKIGAVTTEQHDKDICYLQENFVADDNAVKEELYDIEADLNAKIAETKAVIVTVSNNVPSHTSQEIYALIQAGKVVYLELWGNTYTICTACTESEAKFENSYVSTITGADGKSYSAQAFRLFVIKNGTYASTTTTIPAQTYVDAMIQYYLNQ